MRYFIFLLSLSALYTCVKPPAYSEIPSLEFVGFSKTTMNQGIASDSLTLILYFTDGDGDFGILPYSSGSNIFIKDLRTKDTLSQYKAPFIPIEGAGNGISGTISIKLYSTCCVFPPSTGIIPCSVVKEYPSNDLAMEVKIIDRAGHESNIVTTPAIKLLCQ